LKLEGALVQALAQAVSDFFLAEVVADDALGLGRLGGAQGAAEGFGELWEGEVGQRQFVRLLPARPLIRAATTPGS
jgi:hypothetical protein